MYYETWRKKRRCVVDIKQLKEIKGERENVGETVQF